MIMPAYLNRIYRVMQELSLDALVASTPENVSYLGDLSRIPGVVGDPDAHVVAFRESDARSLDLDIYRTRCPATNLLSIEMLNKVLPHSLHKVDGKTRIPGPSSFRFGQTN